MEQRLRAFAAWVVEQRQRKRWTQADLHRASGISEPLLSRYARAMSLPDPENCARLAAVFGVPVDEVMQRAGHLPPDPGEEVPPPTIDQRLRGLRQLAHLFAREVREVERLVAGGQH